jgi:hypothetical protein
MGFATGTIRIGQSHDRIWLEQFLVGVSRLDIVPTCDAHHVRQVQVLAGRSHLERAVRGGRRGCGARLAGRHYLNEQRVLGPRWHLLAARLAHHLSPVGSGREPGSPSPKSCHACWMVMPTQVRNSVTHE